MKVERGGKVAYVIGKNIITKCVRSTNVSIGSNGKQRCSGLMPSVRKTIFLSMS